MWDLNERTVAVPERKKAKYMAAIEEWERRPTHALLEVQQLHGKLLHISLAVPAGRAYLTNLQSMLGIFHDCPFLPRPPSTYTAHDLKCCILLLQRPTITQ